MNDFTKEELKQISIGLSWWFQGCGFMQEEEYKPLVVKIQSMIDNYCEHSYRSVGNHPWLHCIKCKENFDYDN
jgi:hypothetical protein